MFLCGQTRKTKTLIFVLQCHPSSFKLPPPPPHPRSDCTTLSTYFYSGTLPKENHKAWNSSKVHTSKKGSVSLTANMLVKRLTRCSACDKRKRKEKQRRNVMCFLLSSQEKIRFFSHVKETNKTLTIKCSHADRLVFCSLILLYSKIKVFFFSDFMLPNDK